MEINENIFITNEGFAVIKRDTHIKEWVIENKKLDFDNNALPAYEHLFKGGTLLNVGANIGCYAFPFIDKAEKIICFEPNPEAFFCLKYNIGKYKNVELFNLALSNKEMNCDVICENNNIGMAYINENPKGSSTAITIDSLNLKQLSFIIMDCEGFELDVLIGGANTIKRFTPTMVIEINEHTLKRKGIKPKDIFKWLDVFGYSYKNIYEGQDLTGDQFDIICEF